MKTLLLTLFFATSSFLFGAADSIQLNPFAHKLLEESGYEGCILLFNPDSKTYEASHPEIATKRFIPASTFKIVSGLSTLQARIVASPESILKWDGIERERAETNQDLTLARAFQRSSVPHFQELVRSIGQQRMQAFVDSIPYGNQNTNGGIDQFWLTGELRISPHEQVELLHRLRNDELPFRKIAMSQVRSMMLLPAKDNIQFSAKTGLAVLPENEYTGWWVGWAQKGKNTVLFATVLRAKSPPQSFLNARISLTKAAINEHFNTKRTK